MQLVPLRPDTLVPTQRLAAELFPWEHEHQAALLAAAHPERRTNFLHPRGLAAVRFWTTLRDNVVTGLAGLYEYAAQPDEIWLAWYGLHAQARGRGQGAALLDWVIGQALSDHKQVLRLWTTDEEEYSKALQLYSARGFQKEAWPALPGESWNTLVLSLGLDGNRPAPWAECSSQRELCGREAPPVALVAA